MQRNQLEAQQVNLVKTPWTQWWLARNLVSVTQPSCFLCGGVYLIGIIGHHSDISLPTPPTSPLNQDSFGTLDAIEAATT